MKKRRNGRVKKGLFIWIALFLCTACSGPAWGMDRYEMEGTGIIPGLVSTFAGRYYAIVGFIKNGPVRRTGLQIGDKLLTVNGKDAERHYGTDGLFKALNPPKGQIVRIKAERLPKIMDDPSDILDINVKSASFTISSRNVPDLGMPRAEVLEPVSPHACATSLTRRDPVRQGDHFFVFDTGRCIGTAQIFLKGSSYTVHFDNLPAKASLEDMRGNDLIFFRPVNQSTHMRNSLREWPIHIPAPSPHPLFVKYSKKRDLTKIAGKVLSHSREKNFIVMEVVAGTASAPVGGAPPPGGGMYALTTIRFRVVNVHYGPETDEIPSGAKKRIKAGDYIGVFYPRREDKNEVTAALVHLLKSR